MKRLIGFVKQHKKLVILITLAIVVVTATGAVAYRHFFSRHTITRTSTKTATKITPVKPVTKLSPLTGLAIAPDLANRPITGVVIENFDPDARPQSGLSQAGVVYEALAEGGITRFLAFFLENRPATLGPVRSVRTYFVDWALEFNAPVAHAGGNADALDLIGPLHMKNMDEFGNGSSFYRASDRYAPHNLYTTSDKLDALMQATGLYTPSDFAPSLRKSDSPPAAGTTAAHPTIDINYSYNGYQVEYRYDPATNDYARWLGGQPHIDRNTGLQIHVKNVVVEYMPTNYGTTRIGEQTVIMATPGSGQAIVFSDGNAVTGTWSKSSHSQRTQLLDAAGNAIPLDAGNTWYSIVPTTKTVTY